MELPIDRCSVLKLRISSAFKSELSAIGKGDLRGIAQDQFNKVARHLLTQNQVARNTLGQCSYRGENGLKCAIGCLISDDEYDPAMEARLASLFKEYNFLELNKNLLPLYSVLQTMHDLVEVSHWKSRLQMVAETAGLDDSVLEEFDV